MMCENCRHLIRDTLLVINKNFELETTEGRWCELHIQLPVETCDKWEKEVEYEDN